MAPNSVISAHGRAFVAWTGEGSLAPYVYYGDLKVDAIQRSSGAVTPIYNGHKIIAGARALPGLWTVQVTGKVYYGVPSVFRDAYDSGRAINLQVHYGLCNNPEDFSDHSEALLIREAYVTDYTTTNLVASIPSEVAPVQETFTLSFLESRWLYQTSLYKMNAAASLVAAVTSIAFSDVTTGTKAEPIRRIYALLESASAFYLSWSDDDGATWVYSQINALASLTAKPAQKFRIEVLNGYVIGINGNYIFVVDPSTLVAGFNVDPYFPDPQTATVVDAIDIKKYGDKIYVLFTSGEITSIDGSLNTEVFLTTGIPNCYTFSFVENEHLLVGSYTPSTDTRIYEVFDNTKSLISLSLNGASVMSVLYTTPSGVVFAAFVNGKVYAKEVGETGFSLIIDLSATDCISHFAFVDEMEGYMVGRYVWKTIDGGITWDRITDTSWASDAYHFVAIAADENRLIVGGSSTTAANPDDCTGIIAIAA